MRVLRNCRAVLSEPYERGLHFTVLQSPKPFFLHSIPIRRGQISLKREIKPQIAYLSHLQHQNKSIILSKLRVSSARPCWNSFSFPVSSTLWGNKHARWFYAGNHVVLIPLPSGCVFYFSFQFKCIFLLLSFQNVRASKQQHRSGGYRLSTGPAARCKKVS